MPQDALIEPCFTDCMAVGRMAQVRFSVVRILLTECIVWPNLYNLCHFSQLSSEI